MLGMATQGNKNVPTDFQNYPLGVVAWSLRTTGLGRGLKHQG